MKETMIICAITAAVIGIIATFSPLEVSIGLIVACVCYMAMLFPAGMGKQK